MSRFHQLHRRRWEKTRLRVFDRDGWRCRACGKAGRLECDHIRPVEAGGAPWDLDNLQALCRGCHISKHRRRDPEGRDKWRALIAARLSG